jgi:hypothetical protein
MLPEEYDRIKQILEDVHHEYALKNILGLPTESVPFALEWMDDNKIQFIIKNSGIASGEFTLMIKRIYRSNHTVGHFVASYKKLENMVNPSSLRSIGKIMKRLFH